ncbi:Nn.00g061030.m01.CDS01 [Neocucurbitaria sp. VM-36]
MYPQSQFYGAGPAYPIFSTSATGIPVNIEGELVKTEARGIFISNLHYDATEADLATLFSIVGNPLRSCLHRHQRNKKSKGVATAEFRTVSEAQLLQARLDKEATATGVIRTDEEPFIVNGSWGKEINATATGVTRTDEEPLVVDGSLGSEPIATVTGVTRTDEGPLIVDGSWGKKYKK